MHLIWCQSNRHCYLYRLYTHTNTHTHTYMHTYRKSFNPRYRRNMTPRSLPQPLNVRQLCAKFAKKRNKIKRHSITCSHIWHVDMSVCVYWVDTYSVKFWRQYVQPNANAAHFCDIFSDQVSDIEQYFYPVTKNNVENQKSAHVRHN